MANDNKNANSQRCNLFITGPRALHVHTLNAPKAHRHSNIEPAVHAKTSKCIVSGFYMEFNQITFYGQTVFLRIAQAYHFAVVHHAIQSY